MFSKSFWRATAERTISTAAQAALAMLGADGLGVIDVDWGQVGSVSGLAAVLAVLKALAASQTGSSDSPSLGGGEVLETERQDESVQPAIPGTTLPDAHATGRGQGIAYEHPDDSNPPPSQEV